MCIPRVSKGILRQIPRAIYSHTEVSLRYFYLMDYYLISTGTGISIYTRPMSLVGLRGGSDGNMADMNGGLPLHPLVGVYEQYCSV